MVLTHFFLDLKHGDAKAVLLYRFHIVVILVNLLAVMIDLGAGRAISIWIETGVVSTLSLNAFWLYHKRDVSLAAYVFLAVISGALFAQIWHNHFGTMSVVFALLLPLTVMPFIRLTYSLMIEIAMVMGMALLLYLEYRNNPANPIIQNPQALFHLAYAALIIYIFGLLYHFSILKTLKELDASNLQKELLLKEVHHRVKNNLNVIASIVGLQANRLGGSEKEQLLKSKTRIESIAMVHEMLYKYENFENIEFESYIKQLSQLLLRMYSRAHNVTIVIKTNMQFMPLDVMIQLGMITNELLTNSIKYAFGDQPGTITVELIDEGKRCKFIYRDDGMGVENLSDFLKSKSLGIKLIHLSAKQIAATVEITNHNGLNYEIGFAHE